MGKPMMFSKATVIASEHAAPKLERRWVKKDGKLESYWFCAADPTVTLAAVMMAAE